jgi:diguanylate cyclase (GGDEF)-like protein
MKPRPILVYGAAVVAAATLIMAGYEVARRFTREASLLDLAGPILAVATALICLAVLDWARNLHRGRHHRPDADQDLVIGQANATARASEADMTAADAIQELERLGNEELGPERTLEEALKVAARLADASRVVLWLTGEGDQLRPCAEYAEGQVSLLDEGAAAPADQQALQQAIEHRRPLESTEGEDSTFLFPLVEGQQCIGALKVTVAGLSSAEDGDAVQELSSQLSQVMRHFGRAVRAPGAYDQAVIDRLTGLYTKRHFINRLTEATGVSRRYGEPLSLVLLDIDSFKMLNSTYGTAAGDRVLRQLGSLIQQNIREVDSAYRYGPDEVAIVLAETEAHAARSLADRLRRIIRDSRALADDGTRIIATASVGIAEFDEDMRGIGPLIAKAEEALYAAKDAGRDRVEVAADLPGAETDENDA